MHLALTDPIDARPGFSPYQVLCLVGIPEIPRHLCESTLPVALAGSPAPELPIEVRLGAAHDDDAPHLHPQREGQLVESGHRQRQDLGREIKRRALTRRPASRRLPTQGNLRPGRGWVEFYRADRA
jgi:hypothetical protein